MLLPPDGTYQFSRESSCFKNLGICNRAGRRWLRNVVSTASCLIIPSQNQCLFWEALTGFEVTISLPHFYGQIIKTLTLFLFDFYPHMDTVLVACEGAAKEPTVAIPRKDCSAALTGEAIIVAYSFRIHAHHCLVGIIPKLPDLRELIGLVIQITRLLTSAGVFPSGREVTDAITLVFE